MTNREAGLRGIAFLLLGLAAGCSSLPAVFTPASTQSRAITQLFWLFLGIAALVFVIVEGALLYAFFRFRRKQPAEGGLPPQTEGNKRIEIIWTAIPAVILVILFIFTVRTLLAVAHPTASLNGTDPANTLHMHITGRQWFWVVEYPDQKVITANEIHIPLDVPVKVQLDAADVIHSFWVPQLGGKTDAIPGTTNTLWIQADKAGTYSGQCAEFCGAEHAKMRIIVIVEPKDQFDTWLQNQQQPILSSLTGDAAAGEQLFLAGVCGTCHTIDGTKAKGVVGPNLTHFASRQTFAGASFPNTTEDLTAWLADPQALKPGNLMPKLNLKPADIQSLVTFLQSLK